MYVPWVEKDNKQSNFDVSTGRSSSPRQRDDQRRRGRPLSADLLEDRLRPRLGFAYDVNGTARRRPRRLRLFWNFTPGGTSSSKAQNQPFLQAQATTTNFGTNIILSNGLAAPPGVNLTAAPGGSTGRRS
jgi:hypothetical protein